MRARGLLLAMFVCTLGQVATTLAVVGILVNSRSADLPVGAGVGPVFCAAGSLVGVMLLPWLRERLAVRELAWVTLLVTYLLGVILWGLADDFPRWTLVAIAGIVSSAAYAVLNYCLSMSVFSIEANIRDTVVVKRLSLPFLVAQAVGPFLTGWLLDSFGLPAIAALLAGVYLISAACVTDNATQRQRPAGGDGHVLPRYKGPAAIALFIAVISTFGMNWYFATTLSYFSGQNLSSTLLGSAMSAIQVAAILGAGLVPLWRSTSGTQISQLFLSSMLFFPCLVALHAFADPSVLVTTLAYLIAAGALTGVASALTASIKFNSVSENQFTCYQRRLSVLTLCATLGGSFAGSSAMAALGWTQSLIACAAICLLLGMRQAIHIKRLDGNEVDFHGSAQ